MVVCCINGMPGTIVCPRGILCICQTKCVFKVEHSETSNILPLLHECSDFIQVLSCGLQELCFQMFVAHQVFILWVCVHVHTHAIMHAHPFIECFSTER